jgi:hypothetical protein
MDRFSFSSSLGPGPAVGLPGMTSLSERSALSAAATRLAQALARVSLVPAVLAMSTAGCLITSTPQFNAQQHTAPFLVASGADPDPRQVVVVDDANFPMYGSVVFKAEVISQDDPAGSTGAFQSVSSHLYIDYGFNAEPGEPFAYNLQGTVVDPGTLQQTTGRVLSAAWFPTQYSVSPGCHTATLVASHIFDAPLGCPACSDDYSMITWQVLRCNSALAGNCASVPVPPDSEACPAITTSCTAVQAEGGASSCPESADGGAP